jgi:hypothetical protein
MKTAYIMRGILGSGKDHWLKQTAKELSGSVSHETLIQWR